MHAIRSVLRINTRKDFESKLGRPIYSFTLYEKVMKATIRLDYYENYPVPRLTFEIETDHEFIMNKILPVIRQIKKEYKEEI
jgi:hypothetical protein